MEGFINQTLGDFLDMCAVKYKHCDALVHLKRNLRYTYYEFNEVCKRVAKGFLKMGIRRGDHVSIWATNYPEWLIAQFATAKIGAVLVTVNTSYKVFELEYLLRQSDTKTLLMIDGFKDSDYLAIVNKLVPEIAQTKKGEDINCKKLPFLKQVVYIGRDEKETAPAGMISWSEIEKMGESVSDEELYAIQNTLTLDDVINMQYTSGTTGFPKGVMLTHYNVLNNGKSIGDNMKLTQNDKLCINVPLFHCFGCVLGVMACVTHGTSMVLVEYYSPTEVLATIQAEKCTAVHGVPTMFIFMLEHPDFDKYDLSSLRTGIMAGSPCPIEIMKLAIDKMNMKEITISYGQTEASPVCTMTSTTDSIEKRVATVGRAMPNIECKIVDPETGVDLPVGTQGEFCARGYNIMKGYYKMEEATRMAIDEDGWLHSGDLAYMDEDGYFKISGRVKDMIIRGGENIYPREIEELLYTHTEVSDVQVVGVPSKALGEEIMAYIILKENSTVTEDGMKDFVRENMARHKVPKYIHFIDEFPMTASGKIQKFKLRDMAVEMYHLEGENVETA